MSGGGDSLPCGRERSRVTKPLSYWEECLERAEAALTAHAMLNHQRGVRRLRFRNRPRAQRRKLFVLARRRLRRHRWEMRRAKKLIELIAYIRERIEALRARPLLARLRRGEMEL